jgi:hypothetical protein
MRKSVSNREIVCNTCIKSSDGILGKFFANKTCNRCSNVVKLGVVVGATLHSFDNKPLTFAYIPE